jgi:hypothetical protein
MCMWRHITSGKLQHPFPGVGLSKVREQGLAMATKDEDDEFPRMLATTEEELRAYAAARGKDSDTPAAMPRSIDENAPIEQLEKLLFGASLDDIVSLSEFDDLEIRPVGVIRQNQESNAAPLARPDRDRATASQRDDDRQARELDIIGPTKQKSG